MTNRWIGVDLDGTLAFYDQWRAFHIREPIPLMLERVKRWLDGQGCPHLHRACQSRGHRFGCGKWCGHGQRPSKSAFDNGVRSMSVALPITCCKDYGMIGYDDRIQLIPILGEPSPMRSSPSEWPSPAKWLHRNIFALPQF
jgi:hypothetical protein